MEHTEPPMEERQSSNLADRNDLNNALDQQDWWDDADVSRLINLEDFSHFLKGCDQLLENSDSNHDDDEVVLHMSGSNPEPPSDEQPKLRQSPPEIG